MEPKKINLITSILTSSSIALYLSKTFARSLSNSAVSMSTNSPLLSTMFKLQTYELWLVTKLYLTHNSNLIILTFLVPESSAGCSKANVAFILVEGKKARWQFITKWKHILKCMWSENNIYFCYTDLSYNYKT